MPIAYDDTFGSLLGNTQAQPVAPTPPSISGTMPRFGGLTKESQSPSAFANLQRIATEPSSAPANPFDSDPGVAQARALENMGISQLNSWLKAQQEQAIIQSGDPALASQAGFGLDPQAGVFAQQNYLSGNADLARVDRARKLAHQAIINRLAARGILRSGDLGYLQGQSNIDFGNQEYDVRQAVLGKLSQFMRDYLDRKQALKQSTLGAYQNAYQNADTSGSSSSLFAPTADAGIGSIDSYLFRRR